MSFVGALGKINIDLLYAGMERLPREGEELYSKDFKVCLGGGLPAVMINCARYGVPSRLGTFLGDDMFSDFARNEMNKYGVEYSEFDSVGYPLNITSAIITERDRTFISYGSQAQYDDKTLERIYELLSGARVVTMQENIMPVYRQLKKEGTILVLDTGYSDDMCIEKYRDMLELADYYTPNIDETEKMTGTRDARRAVEILREFFEKPIVKLGKDGCAGYDGEFFTVPNIDEFSCIDATGAGDAFLSGFVYGLYHNMDFRECILTGNITGGKCVTGIGCLTEYFTEPQLKEYIEKYRKLL